MPALTLEKLGPIALLRLNRPDDRNVLGRDGDGMLVQTLCADIAADRALRCVILTGNGKAFSAGGDLKAMRDRTGTFAGSGAEIREAYRNNIHRALRALYALDLPLIAAVNGPAIGLGCDLACLADIRIAADTARFGVTFLKLGLVPGDGGTWLLPRVVGASRAAEWLFTGDIIDATQAEAWGMVSRVVPHDRLMDEAMALATRIAAQPADALRSTKSMLRQGRTISYDTALELAAANQALAHLSEEHRDAIGAATQRAGP